MVHLTGALFNALKRYLGQQNRHVQYCTSYLSPLNFTEFLETLKVENPISFADILRKVFRYSKVIDEQF